MKSKILLAGMLLLLAGGCAQQKTVITRDSVRFAGDGHPRVVSSAALTGNLANLDDGESLFIATARDGSGALSQPDIVVLNIDETLLQNQDWNLSLVMERCDPDGDGVLDMYCPDLLEARREGQLGLNQMVNFQSFFIFTEEDRPQNATNNGKQVSVGLANYELNAVEPYLSFVAVNLGNKTFEGDLSLVSMLPDRIDGVQVLEIEKIAPNSTVQFGAALLEGAMMAAGGVIMPGTIGSFVDDYRGVETAAVMTSDISEGDRRLTVSAKNIIIEEGQGIRVKMRPLYLLEKVL